MNYLRHRIREAKADNPRNRCHTEYSTYIYVLKTSPPPKFYAIVCFVAFRQGVAQYTKLVYRLYMVYGTAWIRTKISASRSAGKSVQGQLILITLPDLFRPGIVWRTSRNGKRELGTGIGGSVWLSVAGVEAFHAFNWKLRIHVESAQFPSSPKRLTFGSTVAQCGQLSQNMKIKEGNCEGKKDHLCFFFFVLFCDA